MAVFPFQQVIVLKKAKQKIHAEKKTAEDLASQAVELAQKVKENIVKMDLMLGPPKDVCCPSKEPLEKVIPIIEDNEFQPKNISIILSQICWKCRRVKVESVLKMIDEKNELREKNWKRFKRNKVYDPVTFTLLMHSCTAVHQT